MTDSLTGAEDAPSLAPAQRTPSRLRRAPARLAALSVLAVSVVVAVVVALSLGGGSSGPATGAASIIPADALTYVNVSLDGSRPAVRQGLSLAAKFPDYPLAYAAVLSRLGAILSGGRPVDVTSQVKPWLGNEAALALLNTATSTAGSLIVLDVKDAGRARAFLHSAGAAAHGVYRATRLLAYPSGRELAFVGHYLVLGQDASVRAAIDVQAGAAPSLQSAPAYRRAAAGEPSDRLLDAYVSVAGVRRLLAPQGGVVGALGELLYQPALQGVSISLSPRPGGARIQIHSALDPSLQRLSAPATTAFTPTLQDLMPSGSILVLDVSGLDRVAPQVLNAGSAAGVAGGIGPLLSRLGGALSAEGVNVGDLVSIFHAETAVAIIPRAQTPALVVVARAPNQDRIRTELAQLQIPLAQLFQPSKTGGVAPVFSDRQVGSVTAHQLTLANGLEVDYAVFRGLVVISTGLQGIVDVVQRAQTLARDPSFQFVLGDRPPQVTSMVFLNFAQLLTLGVQTGLTSSARFQALRGDLQRLTAIGLSSTRGQGESRATLTIRIP